MKLMKVITVRQNMTSVRPNGLLSVKKSDDILLQFGKSFYGGERGILKVLRVHNTRCGPCLNYEPKWEALVEKHSDKEGLQFYTANISNRLLRELIDKLNIEGTPTTIVARTEGENVIELGRVVGGDADAVEKAILANLAAPATPVAAGPVAAGPVASVPTPAPRPPAQTRPIRQERPQFFTAAASRF